MLGFNTLDEAISAAKHAYAGNEIQVIYYVPADGPFNHVRYDYMDLSEFSLLDQTEAAKLMPVGEVDDSGFDMYEELENEISSVSWHAVVTVAHDI